MKHTKGNTSEYIYKIIIIIIICSSKKHSQGLHRCGRIAGVKIKYEPVQFEGLSDAKIVHSGLKIQYLFLSISTVTYSALMKYLPHKYVTGQERAQWDEKLLSCQLKKPPPLE